MLLILSVFVIDNHGMIWYKPIILELLLANGLDTLLVVEGVPELGDDEELLALDNSLLDGFREPLACLLLVAVVCFAG